METPQAEQHYLINKTASLHNGKIVFYGNEDLLSYKTQPFILVKLKRTPNLDGVIFFTINQFCYNEIFNLKKLYEIIDLNLNIYFAREAIFFSSKEDIKNKFVELSAYFNSFKMREKKIILQV